MAAAAHGPIALSLWGGSRLVMLVISLAALATQPGTSWLNLWQRWDWDRYLTIAEYGYTSGKGPAYDTNIVAFFPGYPGLLRAVDLVVRNWVVSGLLISLAAGAVACVALAGSPSTNGTRARGPVARAGWWPRRCWCWWPRRRRKGFLAAGYTESLFLALGLPAWLAARRRRWVLAGVLTALACTVRIDGAFEAGGIAVMFLRPAPAPGLGPVGRPGAAAGRGRHVLRLPEGHHRRLAGLVLREAGGWSRRLTNPVTAFRNSWANASGSGPLACGRGFGRGSQQGDFSRGSRPGNFQRSGNVNPSNGDPNNSNDNFRHSSSFGHPGSGGSGPGGGPAPGQGQGQQAFSGHGLGGVGPFGPWPFRLDILMVVAGAIFMGWAIVRRRWADLTYVGLAVVALATSTYYMSVAREALLWWPLWIALAIWLSRYRWLTGLYLAASPP